MKKTLDSAPVHRIYADFVLRRRPSVIRSPSSVLCHLSSAERCPLIFILTCQRKMGDCPYLFIEDDGWNFQRIKVQLALP